VSRTANFGCVAFALAAVACCLAPVEAGEPEAKDVVKLALEKLPAQSAAEAEQVYQEIVKAAPDSIVKLVGLLRPPGKEDDSKVRLALHGLGLYTSRPGAEAERKFYGETLAGQLDSPLAPQVKAFLIMQLQLAGGKEAIPAIAKVLLDKELCEYGAQALIRIGGEAKYPRKSSEIPSDTLAVAALREALPKAEGPCRLTLIQALGVVRDAKSGPAILKAIADPDRTIRLAAASALANIGDAAAVDALLKASQAEPPYERSQATDAALLLARRLGEAGQRKEAERICRTLLQTNTAPEDRHVRGAALLALAGAVGADAMGDVLAALNSDDPQLRTVAISAAIAMPGKDATARWVEQMQKANPAGRAAILDLLGRRADSAAQPAILEALKDPDEKVRVAAMDALATTGTEPKYPRKSSEIPSDTLAVGPLVAALATAKDRERLAARNALLRIPGDAVSAAVAKALPDAAPAVRATLLEVLAGRRASGQFGVILGYTEDPDAAVAAAATSAVGVLAEPKDLPTLLKLLLKAEQDAPRQAAERALAAACGRLPDKGRSLDAVLGVMDEAKPPARAALIRTLGVLGGAKALAVVRGGLTEKDDAVQEAALRTLAGWADDSAAPDLLAAAKSAAKENLQVIALRGYARFISLPASRSAGERLKMCGEAMAAARRDEEKRFVLSAVAEVPTSDALKMVEPFLAQKPLAAEAAIATIKIARAIGATSRDEARAAIQKATEASDNPEVRKQAAEALAIMDKFQGYLTAWLAAGPYKQAGKDMGALFDIVFDPEKPDAKDVQWRPATAGGEAPPFVDLNKLLGGGENVAGYLKVQIHSPKAQDALLETGSDDGLKAWLNGEVIVAKNVPRSLAAAADRTPIKLREGWNVLLLKITQGGGDWSACARLRAPDGTALEGIKTKAE